MNMELKKQMTIFEQRTKRIQELIARSDLFENVGLFKSSLSHKEDVLPKVVVCGTTEQHMPKILICDGSKIKSKSDRKKRSSSAKSSRRPDICTCETTDQGTDQDLLEMTQHYQRADLELLGMRQQQQLSPQMPFQMMPPMMQPQMAPQMIPQQENTCECHQPRASQRAQQMPMTPQMQMPMTPQMQMPMQMPMQMMSQVPMVQQVNMMQQAPQRTRSPFPPMEGPMDYGEFESTRSSSRPQTRGAKDQPTGMSCGKGRGICPTEIENRLQEYSENTQFLEQQLYDMEAEVKEMHQELVAVQKEREHLEQHRKMLCSPPPCSLPTCPPTPCSPIPPCNPPCYPPPVTCGPPCEVQLRELREQYKRLQDDFKSKLTEVAGLRTDNEKLKDRTRQAEDAKKDAEKQVRDLELEIKRLKGNLKGPKYLEAQQQVEEQRRQIDLMEIENQRISEQVNLEIHRVKIQFSEKVQELMPLPDILKATQIKLQEAQQMHLLAERNNEAIARELKLYKDKIAAMTSEIDDVKSDQQMGQDAKSILEARVKELEEQLAELQQVNASLVNDLEKFAEKCDEYEKLADERLHEIIQLESQVQSLREETARQVSRIKDRCEIVRRSMQKQIGDLERQLAQSRAQAKAAQSDRDEIRQKMQSQINNLNENFEDAQMRIRNLQGHVNFLKNSYGDTFGVGEKSNRYRTTDNKDPCDCNPIY
ncbi:unnamed protein product [Diabrotica balteata]|uniref:Uncharacterized protein n=1 Tax=Diabrotica balteata TaxID=107213 RepID=A0A9N9XB04_DIABA|nr:unnamed protein product [Diabrotica balteata]